MQTLTIGSRVQTRGSHLTVGDETRDPFRGELVAIVEPVDPEKPRCTHRVRLDVPFRTHWATFEVMTFDPADLEPETAY